MKASTSLQSLDLKRLTDIAAAARGDRKRPRYGNKRAALRAIEDGKLTKQNVVLGMLREGVTVAEIERTLKVSRAYARDIIAKLQAKGVAVNKTGETFRLSRAAH